jgi:hypothetical protein
MAIKPIDETATINVIYHGDTAIDTEASDMDAYMAAAAKDPGCWKEYVKAKSGEKITQFVVGVIPPAELCAIEDIEGVNMRMWRCFTAALRDIIDGPALETAKKKEVPKVRGRVDPDWLARVFGGRNRMVAIQIGMLAYAWQLFTEDDARP